MKLHSPSPSSSTFPAIRTIDDVLPAIQGRKEFKIQDYGEFTSINYTTQFGTGLFFRPNLGSNDDRDRDNHDDDDRMYALRRECRGIKFYKRDGTLAARPYHKFFNLNENGLARQDKFAWNNFVALEKLDGSMVHPLRQESGAYILCTRAGKTPVADQALRFIQSCSLRYVEFFDTCHVQGATPMMEWCSRQQRIVLDYAEDQLVVTGVRSNESGAYWSYERMQELCRELELPCVKVWMQGGSVTTTNNTDGIDEFQAQTRGRKQEEGFVLRWPSGDMVKLKTDWYRSMHGIKCHAAEKDVWKLVLQGNMDDAKPVMSEQSRTDIDKFAAELSKKLSDIETQIDEDVVCWTFTNGDSNRKKFATEVVKDKDVGLKPFYFRRFNNDRADLHDELHRWALDNTTSTTKLNKMRHLFGGLEWKGESWAMLASTTNKSTAA